MPQLVCEPRRIEITITCTTSIDSNQSLFDCPASLLNSKSHNTSYSLEVSAYGDATRSIFCIRKVSVPNFLSHWAVYSIPCIVNDPETDIMFQSSDGILFYIHSKYLNVTTAGFTPSDFVSVKNEHTVLTETLEVLEILSQFVHPCSQENDYHQPLGIIRGNPGVF